MHSIGIIRLGYSTHWQRCMYRLALCLYRLYSGSCIQTLALLVLCMYRLYAGYCIYKCSGIAGAVYVYIDCMQGTAYISTLALLTAVHLQPIPHCGGVKRGSLHKPSITRRSTHTLLAS